MAGEYAGSGCEDGGRQVDIDDGRTDCDQWKVDESDLGVEKEDVELAALDTMVVEMAKGGEIS